MKNKKCWKCSNNHLVHGRKALIEIVKKPDNEEIIVNTFYNRFLLFKIQPRVRKKVAIVILIATPLRR